MEKQARCLTATGTVTIKKEKMSHTKPDVVRLKLKLFFSVLIKCEQMWLLPPSKDQLPETVRHIFSETPSLTPLGEVTVFNKQT